MTNKKRFSLRKMVDEHNVLNGFVFVIVEFLITSLGGLFIAYGGLLNHRLIQTVWGFGIAVNSWAICWRAYRQMRSGEKDIGIRRMYLGEGRSKISAKYPNLGTHTAFICIAMLIPFCLYVAVVILGSDDHPNENVR